MFLSKRGQQVGRIVGTRTVCVQSGQGKVGATGDAELGHGKPVVNRGEGRLVRWESGRHPQHLVEHELPVGGLCQDQVPAVGRIKGSSQDS